MNLSGFDPQQVVNSIQAVNAAYGELMQALKVRTQNEFVNEMASKWACHQAMDFFNASFQPAINQLLVGVNMCFSSVVQAMNGAAQVWASKTGTSFGGVQFSEISGGVDVSLIRENINGVRGIDVAATNPVVAKLNSIANDAQNALMHAQNAVNQSGFIGGTQAQSLIESLQLIGNKVNTAMSTLSTQTISSINNTVNEYADAAGQIGSAFNASL